MLDLMSPAYERISSVFGRIWAVCLLIPFSWHTALSQYHAQLSVAQFAARVAADSKKLRIAGNELVKSERMIEQLELTTTGNKIRSFEMLEMAGEQIKRDFAHNIAQT